MKSLLRKLSQKSWAEIADRSRQHFARKMELYGLSNGSLKLRPEAILENLSNGHKVDIDRVRDHFRTRSVPFFPSFTKINHTVRVLKERFPEHASEIINAADRIVEGRFDLLGHKGLFFQSIIPDWHFEPISGKFSPRIHWSRIDELDPNETGDKKIVCELNRHQYFATLGQAYLLTGDERYANTFVAHLNSWFENNLPKKGINWLSSLEVAFRSISWIWAYHFFRESPSLTDSVLLKMLTFMKLNGRHLETYLSKYYSPNTHLTGEALGLYFIGSFLPEFPEATRWREIGYEILLDSLDVQVAEDGVYCEQSSHYHRYTTDFYSSLLILRMGQGESIEPQHRNKLYLLFDHLIHITQPDGRTPLFGDEDGGRFLKLDNAEIDDFRPTLGVGAVLLERGDLKFVARQPYPELLWLLGPEGLERFDSLVACPPSEHSRGFAVGGIFTARTSWAPDADHILIDCGPHGFLNGGHAHADALNVLISFGGRPLFIDSGTLNYTSDPAARDLFRSTGAHNCLTVNGMGSSIPAGPFSWNTAATCRLIDWFDDGKRVGFLGGHDGFLKFGVDYKRRVELERVGVITIEDRIVSKETNSFELNFILAPHLSANSDDGGITFLKGYSPVARMGTTIAGDQTAEWLIEDWFVSYCYGALLPTKRLRLTIRDASGELSITNVINHL